MDAERELLRPVEEHELKEKSKLWKYMWSLIGLFMVLLIASYMLSSFAVRSVSDKVNDEITGSMVKTRFGNLLFLEGTYEEIRDLYHANEKEFRACLIGNYQEGNYIINGVFLPTIHFQDYDKVVSSPCPDGTLLDMHSHPQQHCIFSEVDISGFVPIEENTLLTVMCSDNEFIFYKKTI